MYSERQRAALRLGCRPFVRRHLFDGATRSGKTYSATLGFILWALAHPEPANYLVASKTWRQINESLIPEFVQYAERIGLPKREDKGDRAVQIAHARFLFAEGGKHDSASKLKSLTARGSFLDEVTEMSEDFVLMCESRCLTIPDWKTVMTCNPEGPGHWVKRLYLDPALDGDTMYERIPFLIPDNPSISDTEVERMFHNNSALWKRRMLRGEWVAATGAVYHHWTTAAPPKGDLGMRWASLDYAASGVAHACLFEQYGDHVYMVDEWRYDGRVRGPLPVSRKASMITRWLTGRPIVAMLVDPATPNEMKAVLADLLQVSVINAPNDIYGGINATAGWLENGHLIISPTCVETIREFGTYVWDEAAAARGESKPVKRDDHAMDATRYGVAGYPKLRRYARAVPKIANAMDDAA